MNPNRHVFRRHRAALILSFAVLLPSPWMPCGAWADEASDYCYFGASGDGASLSSRAIHEKSVRYGRGRPMDVEHIKLELTLDFDSETVSGVATTTLVPIGRPLDRIVFDAVGLDVSHVADASGRALDFEITEDALKIRPVEPVEPGAEYTVAVTYTAKPSRGIHFRTRRMGYASDEVSAWSQGEPEDNRYWFPSFDYPNERATSEMIVTVPEDFSALSNGVLVETRHDAQAKTKRTHWRLSTPHPSYLVSLVVGRFVELSDSAAGIPLKYYVRKKFEKNAHLSFSKTAAMMRFFQEWIDAPYPYESYAQVCVVDFIFGGMENASITTLTERTLHDEAAHLTYSSDGLVAHELVHQWWGDWITCRDWSHLWLNEGFATYFQCLFFEEDRGEDDFAYAMLIYQRRYLALDSGTNRIPVLHRTYDDPNEAINRRIYNKGAWILHMLRRQLGDDLFQRCIREYARRHAGRPVETNDLMRVLEDVSGIGMEEFFDQWLHRAGYPHLEVSYSWDDALEAAQVVVKQIQTVDELTPLFHFEADILFSGPRGAHTETVEITKQEHTFHIPLEARPEVVRFDPEGDLLKKLTFKITKKMALAQLEGDATILGRIEAAGALKKFKTDDVVEALDDTLGNDPFWGVRVEAADALGHVDNDKALEALRGHLQQEDARVREAVAKALGDTDKEEAGESLLALVKSDESPYVVAQAIQSLGALEYDAARRPITKALGRDSHNEAIRSAALEALVALDAEDALGTIAAYTGASKPRASRRSAITNLAKLGKWMDDKDKPRKILVKLLDDPSAWFRSAAISALGTLGDPQAIEALERTAGTTADPGEGKRAREAVKAIREARKQTAEVKELREEIDDLEASKRDMIERLEKVERKAPQRRSVGEPPAGLPFSPGVKVGGMLFVSGQLGIDPETGALVTGGIEKQTRQVLKNVGNVLEDAGFGYSDVVSATVYLTDFSEFQAMNAVYAEFFPNDPPSRAAVEVSKLALGAGVEIAVIAVKAE